MSILSTKKIICSYIGSMEELKRFMEKYRDICSKYHINVATNANYKAIQNAATHFQNQLPDIEKHTILKKDYLKKLFNDIKNFFPAATAQKTITLNLTETDIKRFTVNPKIVAIIKKIKTFLPKLKRGNTTDSIELYRKFLNEMVVKLPLHIASLGKQDYNHWEKELKDKFGEITDSRFAKFMETNKEKAVQELNTYLTEVNNLIAKHSKTIDLYQKVCAKYS